MKLILKIIAVLLLIGYVAFAAVSFYGKPRGEVCKGLDVIIVDKNEIHLIDEKEVIAMIKYEDLYPVDKKMGKINTEKIDTYIVPYDMVKSIRASYYLIGALLGRFGKAEVELPGGCDFGYRPIDQHINGFESLGTEIVIEQGLIKASAAKLVANKIYFDVVSVGALPKIG